MTNEAQVIDPVAALLACRQERDTLAAELDAIRYAAHMPDDYQYGLLTYINMELYGKLILLLDRDGRVIRRSEDIEEMHRLRAERDALAGQLAAARAHLERRQWNGYKGPGVCEDCSRTQDMGHHPTCYTRRLLALAAPSLADGGAGIDE
jgi:hypothetical protein